MTHLFAQPSDELGIELCRKFARYHGFSPAHVKIIDTDGWAIVSARVDGLILKDGFVEFLEINGEWPVKDVG